MIRREYFNMTVEYNMGQILFNHSMHMPVADYFNHSYLQTGTQELRYFIF